MQKFQRFLVNWTNRDGVEHYSEYNSLEDATLRYDQLKTIGYDEYVFLSVIIDYEQLIYSVHWRTVGIIKSTNYQENDLT